MSDLAADLDAIHARRAVCERSDRGLLAVSGRDALALLQNTITQDIAGLAIGASAPSLMLTPKGRPLADMLVVRTAEDAFLLICEPEAQAPLAQTLRRYRLASKAAIDDVRAETAVLEVFGDVPELTSAFVVDGPLGTVVVGAVQAVEVALASLVARGFRAVGPEAREILRIERGVPLHGSDFDESTLPAEAALTEHAIAFEKGCYIGQEPVARLHYRGHANRLLWRLELSGSVELPSSLRQGDREVGRLTSVATLPDSRVVALGYLRRQIDEDRPVTTGAEGGGERTARLVGLAGARP